MTRTRVKIFGERNTATNALKALIETNSAARVLPSISSEIDPGVLERLRLVRASCPAADPVIHQHAREAEIDKVFAGQPPSHAWKHTATVFDQIASLDDALVLFCVRHPLSWLLALYRSPYHLQGPRARSFPRFVAAEWRLTQRDNLPCTALLPHALYEAKLRSYQACIVQLEAAGIPYQVLRFEDIVLRQEAVFAGMAVQLEDPAVQCTPVARSTKDKAKDLGHYIDYYGAERWREEIADAIPAITGQLAWDLFAAFGYEA
jgi:hypothetical protein